MDGSGLKLRDVSFVDLYIGPDYVDLKGMPGAQSPRSPLPPALHAEVEGLRQACMTQFDEVGDPEFSLVHDDVLYRVTVMNNLRSLPVLFLRRMAGEIRDFERLGLPKAFVNWVLESPSRPGLIIVAGDLGGGKTTTAASLLVARLRRHGGLALAIEDPPETQLDGLHGEGRCIQVPASRRFGDYREQLRRAMRTGVGSLLIGEIRGNETALEAIKHSNNGLCVITTVHAAALPDALMRIVAYAKASGEGEPQSQLAQGLAAVIYQQLDRVDTAGGRVVRASFKTLIVDGPEAIGIRSKLREEKYHQILQDVQSQAGKSKWD
ncbi:MAG: twitching motility protein PilT [Burkholderiaceae bacterium]|nr:MAG: twitching motility protein PilT [Burkholderiaceae bacterium]